MENPNADGGGAMPPQSSPTTTEPKPASASFSLEQGKPRGRGRPKGSTKKPGKATAAPAAAGPAPETIRLTQKALETRNAELERKLQDTSKKAEKFEGAIIKASDAMPKTIFQKLFGWLWTPEKSMDDEFWGNAKA